MAQIIQNRSLEELSEDIEKFRKFVEFQYLIPLEYAVLDILCQSVIENKMHKVLSDKLSDYSIPELIKIKGMCVKASEITAGAKKDNVKPLDKSKKKHLQ